MLRHLVDDAADRLIDSVQRQQLVRMRGRIVIRQLRANREQRLLVEVRVAQRQHQVCRSRPERREHDTRLSAQLAVDRRRDAGVRLVAHQDEVDPGAPQFVDQHEDFAAWQPEDAIDAGIGQKPGGRRGRGRHRAVYCSFPCDSTTRRAA